jgi:beta-N-acetylhexosaminidase
MKLRDTAIFIFFILVFCQAGSAQNRHVPVFLQAPTPWADSLVTTLTLEQKIGQLFMVAAWSDPKHQSYDAAGMELLIKKFGIGGVIFFQGSPVRQAQLTNRFQSISSVPLMVGMDAEWGLGMRLDSTISFPRQMTLGAVQDDRLIYEYGREMARQCKRLGVHVSFSPVVDINNNPRNPVISNRSFGENRELVTQYAFQYMQGLQDGGVLANAKHFPGHGDTDSDSHKDLPVIPYAAERLDSLELYPYYRLIREGLGSVMIAHLFVPELDSTPQLPSTLSKKIVHDLLQTQMGFEGLVFTDALNMQGVTKFYAPGDVDVKALQAGNDVLLYSLNVAKAIAKIKLAVDSGLVAEQVIHDKCLKILRAKEWAGLNQTQTIKTEGLIADLNNAYALNLKKRIIESSVTIVRNQGDLAPLCHSDTMKVAVVSIGAPADNEFSRTVSKYARVDLFSMDKNLDFQSAMKWHDTLVTYDLVVGAFLGTSNKASKNFGVSQESARILNAVAEKSTVAMAIFANPYAFGNLVDMENVQTVLVSYQDDVTTQQVTAEIMSGACTADGRLPVSVTQFQQGHGISLLSASRLRWVSPSYLGICGGGSASFASTPKGGTSGSTAGVYQEDMMADQSNSSLKEDVNCFEKMDSIANAGIKAGAYPGCRVLLAKKGMVVYDKSFGFLDDGKTEKVTLHSVYDLASITKVVSSTLAAMYMVDKGLLDVYKTLGDYLDIPKDNPYAQVEIRAMLSHCAGFTPWIPFYQSTMEEGVWNDQIYRTTPEPGFSKQVAEGMYIADNYSSVMMETLLNTPISNDKSYKYSDLGYYFLQAVIEKLAGAPLDVFMTDTFYGPLGLQSMGYLPLQRMPIGRIAPTEFDKVWRKQTVRGFVHDQGAAMKGGVAGHAGVFSNAQDLAVIMQMLLNGGEYAGKKWLTKETIDLFNQRHFPGNRRGLGFDKPAFTPGTGSTCADAAASSFGHTGFTGTMCWADPESEMVYIFLSNRVHPDAENKRIQSLDIRTKIQHEAYSKLGYKAE